MNILLTLGRLAKGLELARSLHQAGHRVVIADPFSLHLTKPSRAVAKSYQVTAPVEDLDQYLTDLNKIVVQEQIELIIPISEEALFTSQIGPRLPSDVRVFGPGFAQMARLHDKLAFARQCQALGLPAPETHRANTQEARDLAQRSDYVIKPVHGCSGIGVTLRPRGAPLTPDDATDSNLIQARLHGRQISSFSVVQKGAVCITVLYEGDVYLGTVSVRFKHVQDLPSVERWIADFVAAECYSGFIAFDFFVTEAGTPFAIECNPRLTSGVHLLNRQDLAALVIGDSVPSPRLKRQKMYQDAHATLTHAVGNITRPLHYLKTLAKVLTTKDVVFDWRDPLPFFLMTPMSWDTISPGLFEGIPLAEAATRDILWTGETRAQRTGQEEISRDGAELG